MSSNARDSGSSTQHHDPKQPYQQIAPRSLVEKSFTPREIVSELDKFIVGQKQAKRAVAIALRNRWRRKRVQEPLRDEITPKNIILIGSTGVGKTEIARRLAKLAQAPFVKVEASKFTEVGYVGRDVDFMIRDLVENAVQLVKEEERERVLGQARKVAEEHVLDLLLPKNRHEVKGPLGNSFGGNKEGTNAGAEPTKDGEGAAVTAAASNESELAGDTRESLRQMLRAGELNDREVNIEAEERRSGGMPMMQVFSNAGLEEMGLSIQDMIGQALGGRRTRKKRVTVPEALEIFANEEVQKLIDQDFIAKEGIRRAEESGIVFLDEIDKIAKRESGGHGPDVSREGVQRDILPIVEGSTVNTKYGTVRTDHVLFIAAGAFHVSKVSDLIPELQGRFPIRVELSSLGEAELLRILKEPQNALPVQYQALLQTEGVELEFTAAGLHEIAKIAAIANMRAENIGARRLHTVFERLLDEISFNASECSGTKTVVDPQYVQKALADFLDSEDLARYIL